MNPYKTPHFFSFRGRVTVAEFWSSFASSLMGCFATMIALSIVICLTVPGEVEELAQLCKWAALGNSLVWLAHIVAVSRRRLRDAGFTAKSYLWLLLPVIGLFIFVIRRLCARGVD